jgi:biotin operon repressor
MTRDEAKVFIAAWQSADSLADVVTATGLDKAQVSKRAQKLRRKGVVLKNLRRDRGNHLKPQDWEDLARWADTCAGAEKAKKYRRA